jgi:histidyl-tRNA synthetase
VIGGGRYDGLIETLGGPHTPAVGWAAGIERLAMMIGAPEPERPTAVIVPLGDRAEAAGQRVLADLRRAGIAADMAYRGNMKKRLSRANDVGASFVIIIGDDELERGEAAVKDLRTGEQASARLDGLPERLAVLATMESADIRHSLTEILSADRIGFVSEPGEAP